MVFNTDHIQKYPNKPGVYVMKNVSGDVLYVGKAKNLKARIKQYFIPNRDGRMMIPFLTSQISEIETIVTLSEREALLLENSLIKRFQPKYNVLLKDDKTFISLMVNHKHKWPMVRLIRYKGKPKENALYFGPYTSALSAKETLKIIQTIFPLRQCSDNELISRKRPCLLYSIHRCIAPCVGKCTKQQYDAYVQKVIKFLKGQSKEITTQLIEEMETASKAQEYERAGNILKMIKYLETVSAQAKSVVYPLTEDCDAIGFYREFKSACIVRLTFREGRLEGLEPHFFPELAAEDEELLESFLLQKYKPGIKPPKEIYLPFPLSKSDVVSDILFEQHGLKTHLHSPQKGDKKNMVDLAKENALSLFKQESLEQSKAEEKLLELQDALNLSRCPIRIECFDTSHLASSDPVASMAAFTDGQRDRKRTRLFKVRSTKKGDDYAAMEEVLLRHYTRAKAEDDLPDLTIIDGGKGHLNIALKVFKKLGIANVDLIAITKEEGLHTKGLTKERVFQPYLSEPTILSPRSPLLFFLQKMRDEAHRLAITFQQSRRKKRTLSSVLDDIPGIGPIKKTRLLKTFGSVKKIFEASEEELQSVKGITKKDIELLKRYRPLA